MIEHADPAPTVVPLAVPSDELSNDVGQLEACHPGAVLQRSQELQAEIAQLEEALAAMTVDPHQANLDAIAECHSREVDHGGDVTIDVQQQWCAAAVVAAECDDADAVAVAAQPPCEQDYACPI